MYRVVKASKLLIYYDYLAVYKYTYLRRVFRLIRKTITVSIVLLGLSDFIKGMLVYLKLVSGELAVLEPLVYGH